MGRPRARRRRLGGRRPHRRGRARRARSRRGDPRPPTASRCAAGARHGHHGVYAFERERGQIFRVDAVLEVDTPARGRDRRPERTVNYAELAQRLYAVLSGEPVDLLETLAQRLADVCLAYALVDAVEITVHKPQAELGVPFDDVTVTIRRERRR